LMTVRDMRKNKAHTKIPPSKQMMQSIRKMHQ